MKGIVEVIISFSVISLISAQVRIQCNEGKGECMNGAGCKTYPGGFEDRYFDNGTCIAPEICCPNLNTEDLSFPSCGSRGQIIDSRNIFETAEIGDFPWQVALMHNQLEGTKPTSVYIGGGSLIHSSFVLTMATKVIIFNATDLMARVGEFDFTDTSDTYKHEDINVKNIIIHEGFVHAKARPNNIALLQLEKPVKFDQNINTVCLPPRNAKFDNKLCTVSSWGKNKLHNANDVFPSILKKTEMKVHPKAKCDGDYNIIKSQINDLPLGIICAGGGEKENCLGHGGSPLVCPGEDGNYYQVGIAAWGLGCTKPNVPIAYTEVSHYVEWIFNKINNA